MGAGMSLIQKVGLPSTTTITNHLFPKFKDVKGFEDFHAALLEVFTKMNAIMPGVHYDVPSRQDVQECYEDWKTKTEEKDRKELLMKVLEKSQPKKGDNSMLVTGVIAPPVAMITKKTAESMPALNKIKIFPDVVFVPTATLLALTFVKFHHKNTTINADGAAPATKTSNIDGAAPTTSPSDTPEAAPTTSPSDTPGAAPTTSPSDTPGAATTTSPSDTPGAATTTSPSDTPGAAPTTSPSNTPAQK